MKETKHKALAFTEIWVQPNKAYEFMHAFMVPYRGLRHVEPETLLGCVLSSQKEEYRSLLRDQIEHSAAGCIHENEFWNIVGVAGGDLNTLKLTGTEGRVLKLTRSNPEHMTLIQADFLKSPSAFSAAELTGWLEDHRWAIKKLYWADLRIGEALADA